MSSDAHLTEYDVRTVYDTLVPIAPEEAIDRVLALPAGSDRTVRLLFRIRRVPGGDLPLERFGTEVLGLAVRERTPTSFVAAGRLRGISVSLSFEAESHARGGSRLVTETRVAGGGKGFRLYWFVIAPFSGLIRRRWLRAVARSGVNQARAAIPG